MTETNTPAASQAEKFTAIARALECNKDEDAFKRSLRAIAKAKPKPSKPE